MQMYPPAAMPGSVAPTTTHQRVLKRSAGWRSVIAGNCCSHHDPPEGTETLHKCGKCQRDFGCSHHDPPEGTETAILRSTMAVIVLVAPTTTHQRVLKRLFCFMFMVISSVAPTTTHQRVLKLIYHISRHSRMSLLLPPRPTRGY